MDMSKYVKMYVSESQERLQRMDQLLLSLEQTGGADRTAIDTLFREAHSIKGMSASMGYENLAKVSHRMEDYLDQFRGGKGSVERRGLDLLFEGVDLLRRTVEEIAAGHPPSLVADEYVGKIGSLLLTDKPAAVPPPSAPARAAEAPDASRCTVELRIASDAPLPSARAYITLRRMRDVGVVVRSVPSLEEVQAGHFSGGLSILLATSRTPAEVQAFIAALPDVVSVVVRTAPAEEGRPAAAEPPPQAAPPPRTPPGPSLPAPVPATAASSPAPRALAPSPSAVRQPPSMMRVDTRLLDNLMDQVGELVTANGQLQELSQAADSVSLRESAGRVAGLVKGLQQQALNLRMMPLEMIADRFPRAVRDLARKRGKEVSFDVVGKEIELDRSVLEELPDPILHILRNCVDHGIEPAEERVRAGKPPGGIIRLEASKERESVVIRVIDDGRGMDPARLRRAALERGIITQEQHDRLSDADALNLITLPGFSTAREVTEVSGRGVGMDVVRSAVESLHGSLVIDSILGQGSSITLRLPLTLAVIAVLLVEVAGERYALPVSAVEQTLEVGIDAIQHSQGQEMLVHEDGLVPLLSLGKLLGCSTEPAGASRLVVLCEIRQRLIGLAVDRIVGYREVVVKALDKALRGLRGLAGVTILSNGTTVLILDLNTL